MERDFARDGLSKLVWLQPRHSTCRRTQLGLMFTHIHERATRVDVEPVDLTADIRGIRYALRRLACVCIHSAVAGRILGAPIEASSPSGAEFGTRPTLGARRAELGRIVALDVLQASLLEQFTRPAISAVGLLHAFAVTIRGGCKHGIRHRCMGESQKTSLWHGTCSQNGGNAPLTHSERINYRVFVI